MKRDEDWNKWKTEAGKLAHHQWHCEKAMVRKFHVKIYIVGFKWTHSSRVNEKTNERYNKKKVNYTTDIKYSTL